MDQSGKPLAQGSPTGFNPPDFWSVYDLPPQTGSKWTWNGQTVALVDAFDDPAAEADLNTYRSQFGLLPCTSGNGCFVKVDQRGRAGHYPRFDELWAFEISIDTQMVSALCAECRILLIETRSQTFKDEFAGVDEAYKLGADEISLSWGTDEFGGETAYDSHFQQRNAAGHTVAVTAASGDSGYPHLWYPAASPYVTAVGGTSLATDLSTEQLSDFAWDSAGSGCSPYEPQPAWQAGLPKIAAACSGRAGADVAFNATAMSVYDSAGFEGRSGWMAASGTSVSTPAIAAIYALAGNASSVTAGSFPYSHRDAIFDVTRFPEGACSSALCNAGPGWDGPTGIGTPRGTAGF
ncbi:MAG TPA: S8 family serine peptidase [Gaiellaceae bacterium]|nr:S8 family serine peptidase [Gaiellaceae bacterium]